MKNITKTITLYCPLCGNDQFKTISPSNENSNEEQYKCADCGSCYSKEELEEENREVIDNAVEEIKQRAIREIDAELKKVFR